MIPLHERTGTASSSKLEDMRRDIFAAHAMAALMVTHPNHSGQHIAENAWKMAVLMVDRTPGK